MRRKKLSVVAILLGVAAVLIGLSYFGDEETFHFGRGIMFFGLAGIALGLGFYPSRPRPTR